MASKTRNWRASQRIRLHHLAHPAKPNEKISVLIESKGGGWERFETTIGEASKHFLDVGLVDGPVQCIEE